MKKIICIFLFILLLGGCSSPEIDYSYGDNIIITKGFFKGLKGIVIYKENARYTINIYSGVSIKITSMTSLHFNVHSPITLTYDSIKKIKPIKEVE